MISELIQMYFIYKKHTGLKGVITNLDSLIYQAYLNHKLHKAMAELHK